MLGHSQLEPHDHIHTADLVMYNSWADTLHALMPPCHHEQRSVSLSFLLGGL